VHAGSFALGSGSDARKETVYVMVLLLDAVWYALINCIRLMQVVLMLDAVWYALINCIRLMQVVLMLDAVWYALIICIRYAVGT